MAEAPATLFVGGSSSEVLNLSGTAYFGVSCGGPLSSSVLNDHVTVVPAGGTVSRPRAVVATNAAAETFLTLMKNGVATSVVLALPASTPAGTVVESEAAVEVLAGDTLVWRVNRPSTNGATFVYHVQLDYRCADAKPRLVFGYGGRSSASLQSINPVYSAFHTGNAQSFNVWENAGNRDRAFTPLFATGKLYGLRLQVGRNTLNVPALVSLVKNDAVVAEFTVPAASGAVVLTLPTEILVSPGDTFAWSYSNSGRTSGDFAITRLTANFESADGTWDLIGSQRQGSDPTGPGAGVEGHSAFAGGALVSRADLILGQIRLPDDSEVSKFRGRFYSGSASDWPSWLAANGAPTSLTVTVPSSDSFGGPWHIDADNVETLAANSLVSVACLPASGGVNPNLRAPYGAAVTVRAGARVVEGVGAVPGYSWAPPTGVGGAPVVGAGPVPGSAWTAPDGTAEAVTKTSHLTQYASMAAVQFSPTDRTTQITNAVVGFQAVDARTTQLTGAVAARVFVNARVSQMALLVLAKGKEPPLAPNPLLRNDGGQAPILEQRLVNMYVEKTDDGPTADARFGRPGLTRVAQLGPGPVRATFLHKGFRYTFSGDTVWRDQVYIGEIPASGTLRWAISDEEIVVVAGRRAYYVTLHNVSRINDPDLPYVKDVKFLAGRFIYFDDDTSGFYRYSKLNDAKNIDGLAFASAELNPDPIVGAETQGELLAIFGTLTTEWHYPTTDPSNPFKRSAGRTYDKGCVAIQTVQKVDNSLFFVGHDQMVYRAAGTPERVSTHDVENALRKQAAEQAAANSAFKVVFGGHAFYVLNIVGHGTWAYDIGYKSWAEWRSWGMDRFRVAVSDEDGFMGDSVSGSIFGFDGKRYDDVDEPIERIVSTFMPLRNGTLKNFNLALYAVQGVGTLPDGADADPVVEMRFSDHLGLNYTNWMEAPLGRHQTRGRESLAVWTSLGAFNAPGRVFEFRCTDFVEFSPYAVAFNEGRL